MGGNVSQETRDKASEASGMVKETAKSAYEDASKAASSLKSKLAGKYRLPQKQALDDSDFAFLTENTKKSREEILRIFQKYNLNRENSEISKQGFVNIYLELRPESKDQVNDVAQHVFRAFDSENSGMISFNEFLVAYALTNHSDMRKKLVYAFDLYDTTKTGFLQKSDVRNVVSGIFDICGVENQEWIDRAVKEIQFDKQDRVTKEEFINGLMKNQDIRTMLSPMSSGNL